VAHGGETHYGITHANPLRDKTLEQQWHKAASNERTARPYKNFMSITPQLCRNCRESEVHFFRLHNFFLEIALSTSSGAMKQRLS
jgi:hypothetical protein